MVLGSSFAIFASEPSCLARSPSGAKIGYAPSFAALGSAAAEQQCKLGDSQRCFGHQKNDAILVGRSRSNRPPVGVLPGFASLA